MMRRRPLNLDELIAEYRRLQGQILIVCGICLAMWVVSVWQDGPRAAWIVAIPLGLNAIAGLLGEVKLRRLERAKAALEALGP
jgi:hypothetical protein